jgi:4-amino-4-deoxy-L-arabinose transferase-like glycosyltransferase
MPKDRQRRSLLALLLLALTFRLLFLLAMPRVLDTADAIHYVETAQHLAHGEFLGYDPKIPIFFPLLGAAAHLIVPDLEWACRLISFLASVLTVIPVYLLARDVHGPATARISGLIIACWPWLADYACRVSTEATGVLLWFTALWLLSRGMRHGGWPLYLSPVALFALTLTRPEGLFIAGATLPCVVVLTWKDTQPLLRRLLPIAAAYVALLLLNMLYVRQLTGVTTANYRVGFIVSEFDYVRFVQTAVAGISDVLPVMLGPVLFLFLGVGLFQPREPKRDLRLEFYVLLLAAAQWGISLFVLSPAPRYLMAPLIVLSIWSACGMVLVAQYLATCANTRWMARLPVAGLLAFFLLHTIITVGSEHLGRRPREPREYKEAGRWMASNLDPGLIFTRKPQVGYYAGMPSTGPALDDSLEEAIERARAAEARYLVVDERYTTSMVPSLRPLLEDGPPPPGLIRLKEFASYPQARVVVFELSP